MLTPLAYRNFRTENRFVLFLGTPLARPLQTSESGPAAAKRGGARRGLAGAPSQPRSSGPASISCPTALLYGPYIMFTRSWFRRMSSGQVDLM